MVFDDLPECASKGEQFSECWVTVLKCFLVFGKAIFKEGFGFSCAMTMSRSLIDLFSRSTSSMVAHWAEYNVNNLFLANYSDFFGI